jgi:hypothetical protein
MELERSKKGYFVTDGQMQQKSGGFDADARARKLIVEAFERARRLGRSDWQTMTLAVLKNRLLDQTDRSFREQDYGARTMAELVRRYPDLVLLDDGTSPPSVRLLEGEAATIEAAPANRDRIRSDLWTSVVDYRSGRVYVWDGIAAIPVDADADTATLDSILPTLSAAELDGWKSEFLASVDAAIQDDPDMTAQTRAWLERRLGTAHLPASLRTPWNQEFKRRVIDRLTAWFAEQKLSAPKSLLQSRPSGRDRSVGADTLRQLILRCVRVMTEDELRQLSLPPSAVLRAYGTAVPGKGSQEGLSRE